MTESQFKTKVVAYIKKQLPGVWVYHASDKWISGIPDLFILYKGVFAAVELKVGKNQATKLQVIVLHRISDAGGITAIVRDMAGFEDVISKVLVKSYEKEGKNENAMSING